MHIITFDNGLFILDAKKAVEIAKKLMEITGEVVSVRKIEATEHFRPTSVRCRTLPTKLHSPE